MPSYLHISLIGLAVISLALLQAVLAPLDRPTYLAAAIVLLFSMLLAILGLLLS